MIDKMKTEQTNQLEAAVEPYVAPAIAVLDIELQQKILDGSTLPPDPGDGGDL
jgi:hypothetical protein